MVMRRRIVALALAAVFVLSGVSTAMEHCMGLSASIADQHACCRKGAMATEARATACCAMSGQSDQRGPAEARVGVAPLTAVRHVTAPFVVLAPVPAFVLHDASLRARTASPVPPYLRQVALLI